MSNYVVKAIRKDVEALIRPYKKVRTQDKTLRPSYGYERLRGFWDKDQAEEEEKRIRAYYAFWYPQYPFMTEQDVRDICRRYGLFSGYLSTYQAHIPGPNKQEVEVFQKTQFRDEDRGYLHNLIDWQMLREDRDALAKGPNELFEYLFQTGRTPMRYEVEAEVEYDPYREQLFYSDTRPRSWRINGRIRLRGTSNGPQSFVPLTDNIFLWVEHPTHTPEKEVSGPVATSCGGVSAIQPPRRVRPKFYLAFQSRTFDVINGYDHTDRIAYELQEYYHSNPDARTVQGRDHFLEQVLHNIPLTENLVVIPWEGGITSIIQSMGTGMGMDVNPFALSWEPSAVFSPTWGVEVDLDLGAFGVALFNLYANTGYQIKEGTPDLKIVAPQDEFLQGLEVFDNYRLRFHSNGVQWGHSTGYDPIIFQPVRYGYLMLTQWGMPIQDARFQNPSAN